ncbi:unnamed protein product [Allacma fusca]|uniref:Uncharacterized protein n=1 Tax=Allacma fusca TaxID=39272 RepID=A0A8J2LGZ8_9HEXA|nr:unnamed protein product [Allacma fusca]
MRLLRTPSVESLPGNGSVVPDSEWQRRKPWRRSGNELESVTKSSVGSERGSVLSGGRSHHTHHRSGEGSVDTLEDFKAVVAVAGPSRRAGYCSSRRRHADNNSSVRCDGGSSSTTTSSSSSCRSGTTTRGNGARRRASVARNDDDDDVDSDVFRDDDSSVCSGAGIGEQGDDDNDGGQELEESASQLIPSPYEQLMLSPNIVFDTIVTGHVGTLSYILDDVIVFARDRHNEFDMSHVIPELPTSCKVTQLMFPNRVLSAPVIRPDLLKAVSQEILTYMYYNDGDEEHVLRRRPNIVHHPDIWRGQFVVNNEPLAIDDDDDDAVDYSIISPGSTVTLPKVSLPVRIFVHRIHERLDMEGADIVRCFPTVFRNLAELPTGTLKQVFRFELMSGVKNRSAATNLHFLFLAYKMTLTEEIDDALEKLKRKGPVTSKRGALRDYDRTFPRTQVFINTLVDSQWPAILESL